MLFRDNIRPTWEDPVNAEGGRFQYQFKPSLGGGAIDEYWNNIVLGMVGGTIEPAEMITGIRLVDKLNQGRSPTIRLEIWFSNFADTERVDLLQRNVEKCMTTRLDGSHSAASQLGKTD